MNPEAVEWLEALTLEERGNYFTAPIGLMGSLYTLKVDHEFTNGSGDCWICVAARRYGELVII
jgi:hypothetical protein